MGKNKTINLEEFRSVVNAIFSHLIDDLKIKEIELTEDYYWEILESSLYKFDQDPPSPRIGSLADDLDFLSSLLSDKSHAIPIMFLHVAPVLRFIGQNVNPFEISNNGNHAEK
ncbi:hypothetical protein [Undibacterium terreum]|uniref:Uncharacterized protein n=1 Tax=Undibacterium terreum TaxID=1224302 RepID=A0A916URA1_9BURK|nr:hypothetical protein [Undibacterium terreum]GGC83413.1 hypothetical protein GCM10011396_33530 [Undibacterium terreum]